MGTVQDIRDFLDSDILETALGEGRLPDPNAQMQDKMADMLEGQPDGKEVGTRDVGSVSTMDALGAKSGQSASPQEGVDFEGKPITEKVAKYVITKLNSRGDMYGNRYWAVQATNLKNDKTTYGKVGANNIDGVARYWDVPGDWDRSILFQEKELPIRDFNRLTKGWPYIGNNADEIALKLRAALGLKTKSAGSGSGSPSSASSPSEGRLPKDLNKDSIEDKRQVMLETPGAGVMEPKSQYAVTPPKSKPVASTGSASGSGTSEADLKVGDHVTVEMLGGGGRGVVRGFGNTSKDHVLVAFEKDGEHWTFRKFLKKIGESAAEITALMKKSLADRGKEDLTGELVGRGVMVASREKVESELDLFSNKSLVSEASASGFSEEGHTYEADADDLDLLIQNDQRLYKWLHDSWYKNFSRKMKRGVFDPKMAAKGMMYVVKDAAKQWFHDTTEWADDGKSRVIKPSTQVIQQEAEALVKEFQDWYMTEGPGSEAASAGSSNGSASDGSSMKPTTESGAKATASESLMEAGQEDVRDVKEAVNSLNESVGKTLQFAKETAGKLAVMNADPSLLEAFRRILHENVISALEGIQDKVVPQLNEMTESMLGQVSGSEENQNQADKNAQVQVAAGGK